MDKFYIVIDELQLGPFTVDELKEKGISSATLVWTDQMGNWVEAKNVEALKGIIKKSPPPIPKTTDNTIKVEAEITKKKQKIITKQTEVVAAKEIKTNFKMFLYSIVIGIISYLIIFAYKDGFANLHMYNKWNTHFSNYDIYDGNKQIDNVGFAEYKKLIENSKALGWRDDIYYRSLPNHYHERQYKAAAENSIMPSVIAAIVSAIVLIIGRYVFKGIKWVDVTSKKEI